MFSWEIRDELEKYNYRISSEIYKKICDSPQIQKIKYENEINNELKEKNLSQKSINSIEEESKINNGEQKWKTDF